MSEGHSVTVRHVDVADDQNNIVSKFLHNLKTLGTIFSFDTLEMFQVQDGTEELPNRRLVINHMRDAVAQRRLRCLRR